MSFLKNLLKSIVSSEVKKEVDKRLGGEPWQQSGPAPQSVPQSAPISGDSWGPVMPDEPNQFNSGVTYTIYFQRLFSEHFPSYRLTCDYRPKGKDCSVFTFWEGERRALVVDVRTDRWQSDRLKWQCERQGVPYLRFYHDHKGWWNTKSYVIRRVGAALGC